MVFALIPCFIFLILLRFAYHFFSFAFCFLLFLFCLLFFLSLLVSLGVFNLCLSAVHAFYTGQVIKSYSNISETATKTKYNRNMVKPNPLFMRQRKQAIDSTTNTSIINKMVMEQTMPTEFTSTGAS